jgi:hypothetical protein
MAGNGLQRATRNFERVKALVDDQRRRVIMLRAQGYVRLADQAAALLSVYETSLETYRQRLDLERHRHGLPPVPD